MGIELKTKTDITNDFLDKKAEIEKQTPTLSDVHKNIKATMRVINKYKWELSDNKVIRSDVANRWLQQLNVLYARCEEIHKLLEVNLNSGTDIWVNQIYEAVNIKTTLTVNNSVNKFTEPKPKPQLIEKWTPPQWDKTRVDQTIAKQNFEIDQMVKKYVEDRRNPLSKTPINPAFESQYYKQLKIDGIAQEHLNKREKIASNVEDLLKSYELVHSVIWEDKNDYENVVEKIDKESLVRKWISKILDKSYEEVKQSFKIKIEKFDIIDKQLENASKEGKLAFVDEFFKDFGVEYNAENVQDYKIKKEIYSNGKLINNINKYLGSRFNLPLSAIYNAKENEDLKKMIAECKQNIRRLWGDPNLPLEILQVSKDNARIKAFGSVEITWDYFKQKENVDFIYHISKIVISVVVTATTGPVVWGAISAWLTTTEEVAEYVYNNKEVNPNNVWKSAIDIWKDFALWAVDPTWALSEGVNIIQDKLPSTSVDMLEKDLEKLWTVETLSEGTDIDVTIDEYKLKVDVKDWKIISIKWLYVIDGKKIWKELTVKNAEDGNFSEKEFEWLRERIKEKLKKKLGE